MATIKQLYRNNINAVILTLLVHIAVFAILDISHLGVRNPAQETEMLIDFNDEVVEEKEQLQTDKQEETQSSSRYAATNIASNKLAKERNDEATRELQEEIDRSRKLVEDVSRQLKKEIPVIKDLKMPEIVNEESLSDTASKYYTGDSNIEYYLEGRFHRRLPKPIYLTYMGGVVEVLIIVDREGNVVEAEPQISGDTKPELLLSYAKTAALRTRFNISQNAPKRQKGKIVYRFVAQ